MDNSNERIDLPLLSDAVTIENRDQTGGEQTSRQRLSWPRNRPDGSASSAHQRRPDAISFKLVMLMRMANISAAVLLIFGSMGNMMNVFSLSEMILAAYGVCFGCLICCLELDISYFRHPIASNCGFLYNPVLRFLFYLLMVMVTWSFGTILGLVASMVLALLSLINTFVLCRYPDYRNVLGELSDDEEKRMRNNLIQEIREQSWRNATAPPWMDNND